MVKINELLTIVIPCYNEENYIIRTLNYINSQININDTIVYIADGGSTDNTLKLIDEFKNSSVCVLDIRVIQGGSVSVGRNNGLKHVNTEYVLFIDADVTITNMNHINDYLNLMIMNDLHLMTSPIYCVIDDKRANFMFKSFNMFNKLLSKHEPFSVGTFFLTKTSIVKYLGGFNENVIHSEDYLLSKKFSSKKFKIGKHKVGQDNRRFKKFGYLNMVKLILQGGINRNNPNYFMKDNNYWK